MSVCARLHVCVCACMCVCMCVSDVEDVGTDNLHGGREVKGEKGDR